MQIGVSNPNVPIFLPRVCTLVLFIYAVLSYLTHKLYLTEGPDVFETVKFVNIMDKFFYYECYEF